MPTTRSPRHGSMQYWPRKRASRAYARVRSWPTSNKAQALGFAGYKVGMSTVILSDNRKHIKQKGGDLAIPVTVVECPPIRVASVRFYKKDGYGLKCVNEVYGKVDKDLSKKLSVPKKETKLEEIKPEEYVDIRINVSTQPRMTGIGKKKPEFFEIGLGGSMEEKFNYAKEHLGKELAIRDVFSEGDLLDTHAITKGKGFQGPVKRFGIGLTSHKAEKARRNPGSLGGWKAQGHFMYRIAHAGQMGYHMRTELNKVIIKIGDKPEEVNPKGGFVRYGNVKTQYILVKGSLQGTSKRLIRFNIASRPDHKKAGAQTIKEIILESPQGR